VNSARHAAEALFKPKERPAAIERPLPATDTPPATDAPPSSEQPSQRKPRILMSSKAEPEPRAEPAAAVAAPEISQATTERAATIPGSEHRRIRTLVTYGMTPEQVAGLYEASLNEVRRIIGNREARKKA